MRALGLTILAFWAAYVAASEYMGQRARKTVHDLLDDLNRQD